MGENAGGSWVVEGAEWVRKHWKGLRAPGKAGVVVGVTLAVFAIAGPIVKMVFFSDDGGQRIWVNGPAQVGDHNTQNNTLTPVIRSIPPAAAQDLVQSLKGMPPLRFSVVTGFDNDSHDLGQALFGDLVRAGWLPVNSMPGNGALSVAGAPSVAMVMPTPQRRGVTVYVKQPSPSVEVLMRWCQAAGLQPGPVGSVGLSPTDPSDVRIEVGDPTLAAQP